MLGRSAQLPVRFASLVRVSTTHVEQKESPQHQHAYIQEEARRAGWTDTGLVYEAELTGAVIVDRPDIQRMLADAQVGLFDAVIMKSISRLGRDTLGLLMVKRTLDDIRVELIALADGYRSFRDPELIFLVHAERAQAGRQEISKNVKAGITQVAKRGIWPAGTLPFGLKKESRFTIVEDPETAPIVRLIFHLRKQNWGAISICKHLNNKLRVKAPAWWHLRGQIRELEASDELERTKDDRIEQRLRSLRSRFLTGRFLWEPRTIRIVLANTAYYGELRYNRTAGERRMHGKLVRHAREVGDWVMIPCSPMISQEDWELVQAVGEARSKLPRRSLGSSFLLSGLSACGRCGCSMRACAARPGAGKRGGDPKGYYACRGSVEAGAHESEYIRAADLEEVVLGRLRAELAPIAAPAVKAPHRSRKQADPTAHIAALEAELRDLSEARFFRREELRKGRMSEVDFDFEMRLLDNQEGELREKIERLKQGRVHAREDELHLRAVREAARELTQLRGSTENLKTLVGALVKKVIVHSSSEVEVHTTFTADEIHHVGAD